MSTKFKLILYNFSDKKNYFGVLKKINWLHSARFSNKTSTFKFSFSRLINKKCSRNLLFKMVTFIVEKSSICVLSETSYESVKIGELDIDSSREKEEQS